MQGWSDPGACREAHNSAILDGMVAEALRRSTARLGQDAREPLAVRAAVAAVVEMIEGCGWAAEVSGELTVILQPHSFVGLLVRTAFSSTLV